MSTFGFARDSVRETDLINYIRTRWERPMVGMQEEDKKRPTDRRGKKKKTQHTVH